MTFPKVIARTQMTTAQRRKAKRASRCYKTPIIVFSNTDEDGIHFRTLVEFMNTQTRALRAFIYWNYVGETPQGFKKPRHVTRIGLMHVITVQDLETDDWVLVEED